MKSNVEAQLKAQVEAAEKAEQTKNIYDPETGEMTTISTEAPLNSKVIWSNEPNPRYGKTKYDWLFIPLSWFLFFFSIFWIVALTSNKVLHFFAIIFLLFSIYCLFFRNHYKKKKRKRYSYEITETDITIILTKKKDVKVRQLPLENVKYIAYSLRKNDVGTIYFNFPNDYKDLFKLIFANSGLGKLDESIFVFFEIEDASDLIEQLKSRLGEDKVKFEKI